MENYIVVALVLALLMVCSVAFFVVSVYNDIIDKHNKVKRSWSEVLTFEHQKLNTIQKIENIVKEFKEHDVKFQSKITSLRTNLGKLSCEDLNVEDLKKVEKQTKDVMSALKVTVENYPELKSDKVFLKLMKEIVEQQENIGAGLRIFNSNVEIFNTKIALFPNNIVNEYFNKKSEVKMFTDDELDGSGPGPLFSNQNKKKVAI